MAAKSGNAIHTAKNRIPDAEQCTKKVRSGQRGPAQSVEKLWRDAEIYRLHIAGKSNVEISDILGVHRNKVSAVIKAGGPPVSDRTLTEIEELDKIAMGNLRAGLTSADPEIQWDATKFYLTRRSILGEPEDKGAKGGSQTVINIFNDLKEGLAKLNYGLPSPN